MTIFDNGFKTPLVRALVATSAVLCVFICSGLYFDWNKSEWASWVQAVGSVVAIIVALVLSERSFSKAVEMERARTRTSDKQRLRLVESLLQTVSSDVHAIETAHRISNEEWLFQYDTTILADHRSMLEALPKLEIPDADVVFRIVRLCRYLKVVEETFEIARKRYNADAALFCVHLYGEGFEHNLDALKTYAYLAASQAHEAGRGGVA